MPPIDYTDLAGLDAADNMGGTKQFFLWAPARDFTSIASLPAAAGLDTLAEITGDHTFEAGPPARGFAKVYCTLDMGELNGEIQGDFDGRSFKPEATAFLPGDDAAAVGMMNQMKNDYGIVLIPLITGQNDTKYFQIGIEDLWATIAPSFRSGKHGEGTKGWEIAITSNQPSMLIYSGTVTLLA